MNKQKIGFGLLLLVVLSAISAVDGSHNDRPYDRRLKAQLAAAAPTVAARGLRAAPTTIQLGSLILYKCLEGNSYGIRNFYCVDLEVPVDYSNPAGDKIRVAFMVHLADDLIYNQQAKNVGRSAMLYVAGGPGTIMHTNMAPKYVMSFGPSEGMQIGAKLDMVFMDQRGMGLSCGMWCVNAYQKLTMVPLDPENTTAYSVAVSKHAAECAAEMAADPRQTAAPCIVGSTLTPAEQRQRVIPFVGSREAARDLEFFRAAAGYDRVWVSGRSYGTVVAQVYAGQFNAHLDGIMIDSAIDVTVPIAEQDENLVPRRAAFLDRTIELCATDAVCAPDLVGLEGLTPSQIVDQALGVAARWPITVRIPEIGAKAGQSWVQRAVLRWHLEYAVLNWEASPWSRGDVARAILRSAKGDMTSLLRMLWGAWGMDVAKETADVDAVLAFTDEYTIYPMVYGADYSYRYARKPNGLVDTLHRTEQYFAMGDSVIASSMGTTYMMDAQGAAYNDPADPISTPNYINATVPSPGWHGNYKILIVGPSIDPFTADTDASNLFARYSTTGPTGRIILNDGPHVSGGKTWIEGPDPGFYCVNNLIDQFIFGTTSVSPMLATCEMQTPLQNYLPLTPAVIPSARDAVKYFDYETLKLPEFVWYSTTATGCDIQGSVSWTGSPNWRYDLFTFNNCQFFPGYKASGSGSYDWLSPNFYVPGADTTFDLAITTIATGQVECFTYTRVAGQEPVTTPKTC